jgi:hypothetical protein
MAKTLQLFRNTTTKYSSYTVALNALKAKLAATGEGAIADGSPILARYTENGEERTLLGIKSVSGYEIFDNKGGNDAIKSAIEALDFTWPGEGQEGAYVAKKPIVNVTETDGKIAPVQGTINAQFVDVADGDDRFDAENVQGVLEELADKIKANAVSSDDKTVVVTPAANGDTDLSVHIDGKTIIAADSGANKGELSTNLSVVALNSTELAQEGTNVKEAYKLIYTTDSNRTAIGNVIKIYKDSSLYNVYLGHIDDTIAGDPPVVTEGHGDTALCFIYQKSDGTYELVPVNVEDFLQESEFKNGLQVNNHEVSVKKDTNSGKVRIADAPQSGEDTGLVDVLTVSSDGVKVDNIQAAINYAVAGGSAALAVEAVGDAYVGASIAQDNNKKVVVSTDVQELTATAGSAATYDPTTGAQTAASTAGTLTGVAESLADSSDIALKVKTYVDGAIAIEAARNDAKNKADIYALNSSQSATAASGNVYSVLTGVTMEHGALASKTEVTLAAVAKTGNAADLDGTFDCGEY